MTVSIIAAIADNGVIGHQGQLPWHLPADLQRFKRLTMGHHLIMGRKTFASLPRLLPGRTSVVLTRHPLPAPAEVQVAGDWEAAIRCAALDPEPFVIGGAQIYALALPAARRLYLTCVHAEVPGDVAFPPLDWQDWKLREEEPHAADSRHAFPFTFRIYDRQAHP